MKYMARRIRSGEWLTRDLTLREPELTVALSGPSTIVGNIDPELHATLWDDKLRVAEDWATMVYACEEDSGAIYTAGVVIPPTSHDDVTRITCAGVSAYASGYIYTDSKLWGPQAAVRAKKNKNGKVIRPAQPEIPRPDPIEIFVDHWDWINAQPHSGDLDVTVTGDLSTRNAAGQIQVPIGNYAEPYRLRKWEAPDLGSEMENLASITPFDFVEETSWRNAIQTEADHDIRVGYPRLGRDRDDLRFVQGENVVLTPGVQTIEGGANHLIGLGKGEAGPSMVYVDTAWDDGRLRRTRVVTDKTATTEHLQRRLQVYQEVLRYQRYDVTQVAVQDHANARISQLQVGDDIRVQAEHPEYGDIDMKVRILSIIRGESDEAAVLTTSASAFFIYRPTEAIS